MTRLRSTLNAVDSDRMKKAPWNSQLRLVNSQLRLGNSLIHPKKCLSYDFFSLHKFFTSVPSWQWGL